MTPFKEKSLLCSEYLHFKESLNIDGLLDIVENMERIECLDQTTYIQLDKEYFGKEILLLHEIDLSLPTPC